MSGSLGRRVEMVPLLPVDHRHEGVQPSQPASAQPASAQPVSAQPEKTLQAVSSSAVMNRDLKHLTMYILFSRGHACTSHSCKVAVKY